MISEFLADLVFLYREALMPYLLLVSEATLLKRDSIEVPKDLFKLHDLEDLKRSGFIDFEEGKKFYKVILKKDGDWIKMPPKGSRFERKEKEEYIPNHLNELVDIIGYPVDWLGKKSKYRAMYQRILKSFSTVDLTELAEYAKESFPDITLQKFLYEKNLKFYIYRKNNPEKVHENLRDRESESTYTEDQTF